MKQTNLRKIFLLLSGLFLGTTLMAQQQVSGTVTGADNVPLTGVTISEVGTTNGALTGENGAYSFSVQEGASLTFSYPGFKTQTLEVGGRSTINIQLTELSLDEVVIVGYGVEKKSTLTGAVASINSEQLTQVPVANSANLLAGRAPGVMTRQNSGLPGAEDTQIRIRGYAGSP